MSVPVSELFKEIANDWATHGKDWTKPGFRALAFYRFGVWRMGIRKKVLRAPFSVVYRLLFRFARNVYGIEIPYSARIGQSVVFEHQGGIVIHGNSEIGHGCIIRQGVTLGNKDLSDPMVAPRLGRNVNVGAGAKILGDVEVGDNATIGANAVVLQSVPPDSVVAGVPARQVNQSC